MNLGAKQVSIIVISAALYAFLFLVSGLVTVPKFTLLYLPIVLLGVFPSWFGISGLAGSMIGAFLGGYFVEGLGFLAWIESVTTLIIYGLNWLLIPKISAEATTKKGLAILFSIYAVTLFVGTSYILWQFTTVGLLATGLAELILLPTFGLNLLIEILICPVILRSLSGKLKSVGMYYGSFWEMRGKTKTLIKT